MEQHEIGETITYTDENGVTTTGVVYGIKKVDNPKTGQAEVVGYLIDTGNDTRVDEIVTEGEEENIFIRQPEQIELKESDLTSVIE